MIGDDWHSSYIEQSWCGANEAALSDEYSGVTEEQSPNELILRVAPLLDPEQSSAVWNKILEVSPEIRDAFAAFPPQSGGTLGVGGDYRGMMESPQWNAQVRSLPQEKRHPEGQKHHLSLFYPTNKNGSTYRVWQAPPRPKCTTRCCGSSTCQEHGLRSPPSPTTLKQLSRSTSPVGPNYCPFEPGCQKMPLISFKPNNSPTRLPPTSPAYNNLATAGNRRRDTPLIDSRHFASSTDFVNGAVAGGKVCSFSGFSTISNGLTGSSASPSMTTTATSTPTTTTKVTRISKKSQQKLQTEQQQEVVPLVPKQISQEKVDVALKYLFGAHITNSKLTRYHLLVARVILFASESLQIGSIVNAFEQAERGERTTISACFGLTAYVAASSHYFSIILDFAHPPTIDSKCWDQCSMDKDVLTHVLISPPRLLAAYPSPECTSSNSIYILPGHYWVSWNADLPALSEAVSRRLEVSYEDGKQLLPMMEIQRQWAPFCCQSADKMHHRRLRRDPIFLALTSHKGSQPGIVYEVKTVRISTGEYSKQYFGLSNDEVVPLKGPFVTKIHAFKNYVCNAHDLWFRIDLFRDDAYYEANQQEAEEEADHGVDSSSKTLQDPERHPSDAALDLIEGLLSAYGLDPADVLTSTYSSNTTPLCSTVEENSLTRSYDSNKTTPTFQSAGMEVAHPTFALDRGSDEQAQKHRMRMTPFTHLLNFPFINMFLSEVGFPFSGPLPNA